MSLHSFQTIEVGGFRRMLDIVWRQPTALPNLTQSPLRPPSIRCFLDRLAHPEQRCLLVVASWMQGRAAAWVTCPQRHGEGHYEGQGLHVILCALCLGTIAIGMDAARCASSSNDRGGFTGGAQDLCIPFAMGDNLTGPTRPLHVSCVPSCLYPGYMFSRYPSHLSYPWEAWDPLPGSCARSPRVGRATRCYDFDSFFCWREAHQRIRRLSKMDGLCIAQVVVSGWPSRLPSELPGKALEEVLKCLAEAAQHGELREDGAVPGSQCPVLSRFQTHACDVLGQVSLGVPCQACTHQCWCRCSPCPATPSRVSGLSLVLAALEFAKSEDSCCAPGLL